MTAFLGNVTDVEFFISMVFVYLLPLVIVYFIIKKIIQWLK